MKTIRMLLTSALILFTCISASAQGAAINTSGVAADPSAMLDVSSVNSGLLMPRMTTAQRNAIQNPAAGLMIINTTTNCIEVYFSPIWQTVFCGCTPPPATSSGTHIPAMTQITWNWNAASGATGYKYNTTNDYATATDNGASTSYTQTGLTCNTAYTLYVWAYNTCLQSVVTTLNQPTSSCISSSCGTVTFTYNGSSVTYGTVSGQNSTCWLDRNLGASSVATAYNDFSGYGDLFQWGRLVDGHQLRTSTTTTTLSSNTNPGHSKFIAGAGNWYTGSNPNLLWQGVSGTNNPCPTGWRIPTKTEYENESASWSLQNYFGAIASPHKFTAAGYRHNNGSVNNEGSAGYYWCSTTYSSDSYRFGFSINALNTSSDARANGLSVRCIKD